MPEERWSVRVTKDYTVFSAAHFITYGAGECERLHGHNYRVRAEVHGSLEQNAYVFDFIALKDLLHEIVSELDHRLLLPAESQQIEVSTEGEEVIARFGDRRWIVPKQDCVILPVPNTTAEMLARWIADRLLEMLRSRHGYQPEVLAVEVEENFGQQARYEWRLR